MVGFLWLAALVAYGVVAFLRFVAGRFPPPETVGD